MRFCLKMTDEAWCRGAETRLQLRRPFGEPAQMLLLQTDGLGDPPWFYPC